MPYIRQLAPHTPGSGGGRDTKGSAVQFRVGYYDRGLMQALKGLKTEFDTRHWLQNEIYAFLKVDIIPETQKKLRDKQPATFDKVLPPTRRHRQSKSIYRRVSDSLDAEIDGDVVKAGSKPFPFGVAGQRQPMNSKKTIAQIVKRGMRPFMYKKSGGRKFNRSLPPNVRSSIKYGHAIKGKGRHYGVASSINMQRKRRHPGFKGNQKFDYVEYMSKSIRDSRFKEHMANRIEWLGSIYGFKERL
tara:strand:+ start:789 stop:1520 length:732 start_codon:yes stop_codon:yes gene_type:complete